MKINEKTKIGKLIKENPEALSAIVTLSPDFKRLLNPVLRKLVAGRTSIAMAAKMGKVTPNDFFNILAPLGFEIDTQTTEKEEEIDNTPLPDYIKNRKPEQIIKIDVRKMIAEGGDPLQPILKKVKKLETGQVLLIVADFEPIPLIKLLERQGYSSFLQKIDAEIIETYFYNPSEIEITENQSTAEQKEIEDASDWEEIHQNFKDKIVEIDVRHLEMPGPMMTILTTLETLPQEQALFVYHKKIPVFLLSELKDRNFDYRIKNVKEGEVYLMIFKN